MKLFIFCVFSIAYLCTYAGGYLLNPVGHYAVGYRDTHLVDGKRDKHGVYRCPGKADPFYTLKKGAAAINFSRDNQKDFCREVMVRLYYPSLMQSKPVYSGYYKPALDDMLNDKANGSKSDRQSLRQLKAYTIKNAKSVNGKFPVVIFSPGAGVEAQQYSNIISSLVSHGYIVLALNNTFTGTSIAFPRGKVVHWIDFGSNKDFLKKLDSRILADIVFVRHQLASQSKNPLTPYKGIMNLHDIGVMGHSIGGYSTLQAARIYPNLFNAAIALDAPPVTFGTRMFDKRELKGVANIPVMRVFAAEWRHLIKGVPIPDSDEIQLLKNNYYVLLSPSEKNITYTNHMSYSDYSTLQYHPALQPLFNKNNHKLLGKANGWHITKVLNQYILMFFNQYLKQRPSKKLQLCIALSNDTLLKCPSFDAQKAFVAKPMPFTAAMNRCLSCTSTRYVKLDYPVMGNDVLIDGHKVWLEKYGQGNPAVVLINGGGETTRQWNTVIPLIAKYTSVIAYDRQGLGQTPLVDVKPRLAKAVSEQLRQLLDKSGVKPPYVLVGHSIGGLYISDFSRRYPKLVAGIVTLDGDNEYQIYWNKLNSYRMKPGSAKLLQNMTRPNQIYKDAMKKVEAYQLKKNPSASDKARMVEQLEVAGKVSSSKQIFKLGKLPAVPIIGLYEGSGNDFYYWRQMMKQYVAQVPCGEAQYVANSSHHIMIDHPKLVNQVIRRVVMAARLHESLCKYDPHSSEP